MTGPSGSPAAVSVDIGRRPIRTAGDRSASPSTCPTAPPNPFSLTASSARRCRPAAFAIGATPAATAANLQAALTSAIGTLANTSLVAASAVAAGDNFFNTDGYGDGKRGQQPGRSAGADHRRDRTVGRGRHRFAVAELRGRRHHHRQRHDAHLRRVGRDRQPAQRHRQRPDIVVEDRLDHRAPRRRRPFMAASSLCIPTTPSSLLGHELERGRVCRARLQRHRDGGPPPLRVGGSPLRHGDHSRQRLGQHGAWYTGNSGPGSARSTATVRVDASDRAVRRPGQ